MKPETFTARVTHLAARAEWPPVRMWEDAPDKRIKIQFRTIPSPSLAALLKKHGFRFVGGPSQHWVRRLDQRGKQAAVDVMESLKTLSLLENPEAGVILGDLLFFLLCLMCFGLLAITLYCGGNQ